MRSSFASRTLGSALVVCALAGSGAAAAESLKSGFQCLAWTDLACAVQVANDHADDDQLEAGLLRAQVAFHSGDFTVAAEEMALVLPKAWQLDPAVIEPVLPPRVGLDPQELQNNVQLRQRLQQAGYDVETGLTEGLVLERASGDEAEQLLLAAWMADQHGLYLDTVQAHAGLVETQVGDVVVAHHPGIERILVQDAVDAIETARERIAPMLGGDVDGVVRVEIYPDTQSFILASGLPAESVKTTGVVAISKWNRLLVSSPRALGVGYGWRDTLVHEWVHYIVSYNARDQAPIWLQEGLAKSTEMYWHQDHFELEVSKQSQLAEALRTDEWVTFEQMHPSMAYLPSADMASLAYAQVATMMEYLRVSTDDQVLSRVIERVAQGQDARDAVAAEANGGDFQAFEDDWKRWLRTLDLVGTDIASMPMVGEHLEDTPDLVIEPGEGDFRYDPVLSRRLDLANRARLGDLMFERGQYKAALVYYLDAVPEDEPASPMVVERTARVYIELGQPDQAMAVLSESLRYYPQIADNQKLMGELLRSEGRDTLALQAYAASAEIDPFDVAVHQALAELYAESGDRDRAARHTHVVDILLYRESERG